MTVFIHNPFKAIKTLAAGGGAGGSVCVGGLADRKAGAYNGCVLLYRMNKTHKMHVSGCSIKANGARRAV